MAWQLDVSHSHIQFAVRHMMVSTVRGQFTEFSGTVAADEQDPTRSTVEVRVAAASIDTREARRDAHLRSPEFLDADQYPDIVFRSTRVEQTDAEHARLVGDLTIRGVTREVALNVEYAGQAKSPWGTVSAGFSASTKINRKDWGLVWNQALETGGVLVGDEIKIDIEVELVEQAEQAEAAPAA